MNIHQLETKQQKSEKLTDFIQEQGQWADDYVEHEDNINHYAECLYHGMGELYLEYLDDDIKELVKNNEELALEHAEPELIKDFYKRDNQLMSINIGEIETQLTGLSNNETDCIFTELCKGLSKEEIQEAADRTDYHYSSGSIYSDFSYWRVGLILNVDEFKLALDSK